MTEKVSIFRKIHFNSAHRLYVKFWSDEENDRVFGKCNNPNFHGHNYELIVKVTGVVDKTTGFVMNMTTLNDILQQEIVKRFDHRNLNLDVKAFEGLNPTAENIAIISYNLIRSKIDADLEVQVRLYETERNFVEYPAS